VFRLGAPVAVTALVCALLAASARAAPQVRWSNSEILERLERGEPLVLKKARIRGDLDLTTVGIVRELFICTDCSLKGSLLASNVVFKAPVDLSGLQVLGRINLHGATFEAPALFGAEWADDSTVVRGDADFSFVTFEDFVGFEGAIFFKRADFRLARFRTESVFADVDFDGVADFTAAIFGGPTRLGQADFEDATFARADFQHRVDFNGAEFTREAEFARTRFAQGASFRGTFFFGRGSVRAASFELTSSQGKLDFAGATFSNRATFKNLVASSTWFDGTTFSSDATVTMTGISASDLLLAIESVDRVQADDQRRVLRLIESSAKSRGDLTVANQAHYRLQVLASRDDILPRRIADGIFYRGLAGYFVKFWRPIVALFLLAFVVSVYRVRKEQPVAVTAAGNSRAQWIRHGTERSQRVLNEFLETLALIGPGVSDPPRRLERLTYRVLFVCGLLGLANSNPTLRQMVDTLF